MSNYTVYHLHSDLSNGVTNIDSITKYNEYIDYATSLGMKAMAFSEHGSIFEWLKKKESVEKAGMKYIHAEEFYVTENKDEKVRDNYHCVLIAKNYEGVLELNKLSSISFNREDGHYYYNPRITFEELINTSDNIIICTACLASILASDNAPLKERFICFLQKNKHRCFLEIQHHNVKEQKDYNSTLLNLHKELDIPLIAGTDTHALNAEHLQGRTILQKAKKIHFDNEDGLDLSFKTYDELVESYAKQGVLPMDVVKEAIENTNIMADMVEEFTMDRSYKYPHLWDNPEELLREKIHNGIISKGVDKYPNYQEYLDRVEYEMEAYKHNEAIDFMLLMEDIISWCKSKDIQTGYGRGSVNGSVIAWLIGITEMDSIKFGLNFERFMNVERVSLSDIDTDFPPSRIAEVKEYIFNRHGLYCSDIVTFNTIADKGAIRDVGRALDINLDTVGKICEAVDDEEKYREVRNKYKELFKYVDLVKGVVVSVGSHPCGTIVAPYPIDDKIGLFTTSTDPFPVSQLYMKEVDSLNYVKLDLLKLDTIELISETCKLAKIPMLIPDNMDILDEKVWESIRDDTTSVFQWESATGQDYIRKLLSKNTIDKYKAAGINLDKMTLLSIGNSAIRPAGASYRNDLASGVVRTTGSKPIDEFLSNTFGYLVFQCQIIEFLHKYCGFTMGEADIVRRCVDENTLVTMANGNLKKIKNINVGDEVISFSEEGFSQHNTVTNVFDNGEKECVEIKLQHNNTLICTKDHKVLTQDGFKCVKDLTTTDCIMSPSRITTRNDDLRSNQRLSADTMFMIGLLLGDGTLSTNSPRFTNHDIALIDRYKECVNQLLRGRNCEFTVAETDGISVDKIYAVSVKSLNYRASLVNLLDKYDLRHLSADKYIPDSFMSYPIGDKLTSLIAGLFNTDGVYNTGTTAIEYCSTSYKLCIQLKYLLLRYGIYSYVLKKYVKDYDYYSYSLCISQPNSLKMFGREILKFIIGEKYEQFKTIIEAANRKKFNYYLPNSCKNEILDSCEKYNKSVREMSYGCNFDIEIKNDTITDTKGEFFANKIYCPNTYKLLRSDYQPIIIKEINPVGVRHVYDIEVDNDHNYVANNLIVHNCFAKKTGTQDCIPVIKDGGYITEGSTHHIDGYIKTMKNRYGISEEKSEEDIVAFIKVIEDASSYLFSLNHSQPYSFMGYACAYLRYYYPTEFITCCLNINKDNSEKTTSVTEYAKKVGVKIVPIRFGYSRSDYSCDAANKTIYKGVSSVKNLNEIVSEQLYELSQERMYDNFIDLLHDITVKTSCNSRQLDILIKLNYFSDFGEINELLQKTELFQNLFDNKKGYKKQMKRSTAQKKGVDEELLAKYSDDFKPSKTNPEDGNYPGLDSYKLLTEFVGNAPVRSLTDKIKDQKEYLSYIQEINPDADPREVYVSELSTNYSPTFDAYCLKTGETKKLRVYKTNRNGDGFNKKPFSKGDFIYLQKCEKKSKTRVAGTDEHGNPIFEPIPGEFNWWVTKYDVLTKK